MSYISNIGGKLIVKAKEGIDIYAKGDIVYNSQKTITFKGEEGIVFGKPETFKSDSEDFEISFSLSKKHTTLVPLGILDFNNKYENPFFVFDYSLRQTNLESLNFEIFDDQGNTIYQTNHIASVVVEAQKAPKLFSKLQEETPPLDPLKPIKTFDIQKIIDDFLYPDLTHIGSYHIFWDGFDNKGIFDSTRFDGKKLKAKITARKGGTVKSLEIEFETSRKEVDWVDVKIDKNSKRIDVTLRVNLTDGGAEGLSCWNNVRNFNPPHTPSEFCDWDKIPKEDLERINKPIIKSRTKSFEDLEKLALEGLNYHWGRNSGHAIAKNVTIGGEIYEVFVNPVNTTINAMDDIDLVYNTNNNWLRSNNPGKVTGFKSFLANAAQYVPFVPLSESIYYSVGYLNNVYTFESTILLKNKWTYLDDKLLYKNGKSKLDLDYSYTSAHEIGHTILRAYAEGIQASADYSYQHKESSGYSETKPISEGGFAYPSSGGEIDLMKYYNNGPRSFLDYDFSRIIAEEKDVLGLLWLTKIKLK